MFRSPPMSGKSRLAMEMFCMAVKHDEPAIMMTLNQARVMDELRLWFPDALIELVGDMGVRVHLRRAV